MGDGCLCWDWSDVMSEILFFFDWDVSVFVGKDDILLLLLGEYGVLRLVV